MKKIIVGLSIGALALVFAVPTISNAVNPLWDVTGYHEWVVLGTYHHDIQLTQNADGTFTGTGGYPAGGDPYTGAGQTTETLTGSVVGNVFTMTMTYNGPYNAGYTVTVTGTISDTGVISGMSPWPWYMTNAATDDTDEDGVLNDADLCAETTADSPDELLGVNRHAWYGGDTFTTIVGGPKNTRVETDSLFTLDDTMGCSCEQIISGIEEATGLSFDGHEKFGCSKSLIEDWMSGTYYVGPTWIETVEVPANEPAPTMSVATLDTGKDYFLQSSGTAFACNQPGCIIEFDADYSTSDAGITPWVDGVATPYDIYGPNLLDLKVDDAFINWGAYSASHAYQIPYAGTGSQVSLFINDLAGSHFNNSGSLFVDIIEDKWVDLW